MTISKQWLVDPANPETPAYITSNPDVAKKRANKGDFVVLIERVGEAFKDFSHRPHHKRLRHDVAPTNEDDEL